MKSVDVVTTKDRAFREFHRVLRAGSRVSMFEPTNNYFPDDPNDFRDFDARPVRDLVEKISAYEARNGSRRTTR